MAQKTSYNWQTRKLGEVCDFFNGKAHENCIDENGNYIVVNSKFISSNGQICKKTKKQLSPLLSGDIAMVMSDVPNGKTLMKSFLVYVDGLYTLNQRICAIRSKNFDSEFLHYQLNRNKYFLAFDNCENQTNLRKDDILNCPLLIPPIPEQHRIVKILDEIFEKIAQAKENVEKNFQNAKELFAAYLQSVFANTGSNWEEKNLGDVCEMINRGVSPKYIESTGLCVLNQKCIRDHKINFELSRRHDITNKKVSAEKFIQIGDVLVNSTGTGTLGRVAQVRVLPFQAIVDSHVTIIRPIKNLFYNEFFGYTLIFIEKEIAKRGEGCGGQTELARDTLKNDFKITYPKSLIKQQQIVSRLDALSAATKKLEAIYKQKLANLAELKKSVLKKAFAGEL